MSGPRWRVPDDPAEPLRAIPSHRAPEPRRRPRITTAGLLRIAVAALVASGLVGVTMTVANANTDSVPQTVTCPYGQVAVLHPGGAWECVAWPFPASPSASATPTPTNTGSTPPSPTATTGAPSSTPSTPAPTTSKPPAPAPTPTPTGGRQVKAELTGYSYYDNTPPGSAQISNPILHDVAGGTGTYLDPITVAVGHTLSGGKDILDWPEDTRFYVPALRRYLIVEDTCGDGSHPQNGPCHVLESWAKAAGATTWLDVWVGGKTAGKTASNQCMSDITDVVTVIVDPPAGLPVTTGDISTSAGCVR